MTSCGNSDTVDSFHFRFAKNSCREQEKNVRQSHIGVSRTFLSVSSRAKNNDKDNNRRAWQAHNKNKHDFKKIKNKQRSPIDNIIHSNNTHIHMKIKKFKKLSRFVTKTKEGFDFRKRLSNPRIDEKVVDLANYGQHKFTKSEEENLFLLNALKKNFFLNHLESTELWTLALAFEKVSFDTKTTVVEQGDTDANYYYIVYSGCCEFHDNDTIVGSCAPGNGFGELALLHSCPRAAKVITTAPTVCFRIDKESFQCFIVSQKQHANSDKIDLLRKVPFLKNADQTQLQQLMPRMVLKTYRKCDYLTRKGEPVVGTLDIIYQGEAIATDIDTGGNLNPENFTIGVGDHYGERGLVDPNANYPCNIVPLSDEVSVYSIDRKTFQKVLGDLSFHFIRSRDKFFLETCLKNTFLEESTFHILSNLIEDHTFSAGTYIMTEGEITKPAFYIIRSGKCRRFKSSNKGKQQQTEKILGTYGAFGQDQLMMDVGKTKLSSGIELQFVAGYSVLAVEDTVCGVLTLKDCRSVFDTTLIGEGKPRGKSEKVHESLQLDDLTRHTILGQGSYGQVWLVSANKQQPRPNNKNTTTTTTTTAAISSSLNDRVPFAMKIQSKYDLLRSNMATNVVREVETMSRLQHPFLISLVKTYQDSDFTYMLLPILQGGDLSDRIYSYSSEECLPEADARFYAACLVEALSFMHQKRIVHRDLKPENILLDNQGYPVIMDFGLAKHITDKTYTFVGTPLYMAPEVILQKGHTTSVDNWSLGCIIYEMLVGWAPFHEEDIEPTVFYKSVCTGRFCIEPLLEYRYALDLVTKLLVVLPSLRLGSMVRGQMDVLRHAWFYEINFALLRRKEYKAVPWQPQLQNMLDTSNFTDCSDLQDITTEQKPKLLVEEQELFEVFGVL